MQGIQQTVLALIQANRTPYITRKQINAEMAKTSLGECQDQKYASDTKSGESLFERRIDQAIVSLRKAGYIKKYRDKKAKYTITTPDEQVNIIRKLVPYKPNVCQALTKHNGRPNYCPVQQMFIGDPKMQCEHIWGTNDKLAKISTPMRPCYFDHKPKELEMDGMRTIIESENARAQISYEEYLCNKPGGF